MTYDPWTTERASHVTAKILVEFEGEKAEPRVAQLEDELMASGDVEGCAVWFRVAQVIDTLLMKTLAKRRTDGRTATKFLIRHHDLHSDVSQA